MPLEGVAYLHAAGLIGNLKRIKFLLIFDLSVSAPRQQHFHDVQLLVPGSHVQQSVPLRVLIAQVREALDKICWLGIRFISQHEL